MGRLGRQRRRGLLTQSPKLAEPKKKKQKPVVTPEINQVGLAGMAATYVTTPFYTTNYGRQDNYTWIDPLGQYTEVVPIVDPLDTF